MHWASGGAPTAQNQPRPASQLPAHWALLWVLRHPSCIVVKVVDLLDFHGTFVPDLHKLVGRRRPMIVAANKVPTPTQTTVAPQQPVPSAAWSPWSPWFGLFGAAPRWICCRGTSTLAGLSRSVLDLAPAVCMQLAARDLARWLSWVVCAVGLAACARALLLPSQHLRCASPSEVYDGPAPFEFRAGRKSISCRLIVFDCGLPLVVVPGVRRPVGQ